MATVWAKINGAWNGSIWDYFNEETQQVEAYPYTKPQSNDTVYLDGFAISANENINIGNGTIRNDLNPYTNLSGGKISIPSSLANVNGYVNANIIGGDVFSIGSSTINVFTFIGNIKLTNRLFDGFESLNKSVTINGNVDNSDNPTYIYCSRGQLFTINGNVIKGNSSLYVRSSIQSGTTPITINGNLTTTQNATNYIGENVGAVTFNIGNIDFTNSNARLSNSNVSLNVGNLYFSNSLDCNVITVNKIRALNNAVLNCTTLNVGQIEYQSTNNQIGVRYTTMNILNANTFVWKDLTEPRSNPFIILTDAEMNNRQQYPAENKVKEGTEYVWGEKVGTYQQPPESVVLKGYRYDNDEKEGTLENQNIVGCVTPEDVRKDVPLVGMGVVGSLVVPSVDDVREGVIFDNGSVGTLIVEGGGDRLRIADFGYYTNAQSDTYIVDLTEQDKPKFAVAEERVLIEMFPDLDLDNIPDKYFDDLFVKYLKYRLIVEYYRTAGINSTFTPSEPTTEIVNYQNVRNEVWLNSANIYLKAWSKKYPESITKPQRILL